MEPVLVDVATPVCDAQRWDVWTNQACLNACIEIADAMAGAVKKKSPAELARLLTEQWGELT